MSINRNKRASRTVRVHARLAAATLGALLLSACTSALQKAPARPLSMSARAQSVAESRALAPTSERCAAGGESARLYFALPYGSEAAFNPVSQILNEGFDYWQLGGQDRRVESVDYRGALRMIGRSVKHPDRSINKYGKRNWLREELLPVGKSGAWVPNYQLHLLGSGMQSARMTEWYRARNLPHPRLSAAVTMMTSHMLNEIIELRTDYGYSGSSMTDLLLFDLGGIALFQTEKMQRFACRLRMTAWQGIPSYNPREKTVNNASQYFVGRWTTSDSARWSAFVYMGLANLVGASRSIGDGRSITFAAGATGGSKVMIDSIADITTVSLHGQVGMFVDRANSLLVSALYSPAPSRGFELSLYPGAVRIGGITPSLWTRVPGRGQPTFGIALGGWPGISR